MLLGLDSSTAAEELLSPGPALPTLGAPIDGLRTAPTSSAGLGRSAHRAQRGQVMTKPTVVVRSRRVRLSVPQSD